MNTTTFRRHYVGLIKKVQWLQEAKRNLEFGGDTVTDPLSYHRTIQDYEEKIEKYTNLQNTLLRSYSNEIQARPRL